MIQNLIVTLLLFLSSGVFAFVCGQSPASSIAPSVLLGEVSSVGDKKIVITTDKGPVEIIITDRSIFKRVSAENPSLTAATTGAITDISVGDKITVSGIVAADGKSIPARSVYFMTAADIEARNAKQNDEWQRRGVKGKVVSVNTQTNQIGLEISGLTGTTKMILTPKENAKFLRYAQDSIRFDEAVESSLGEVKVGDMIRATGDKSSDNQSFAAEQILAGAFQTTAGTIKSIDTENALIVIKNLQTNKDVTVVISKTSVLKRFPAEQAEMFARMQMAGAGGARPMGQGGMPARPAGGGQGRAGGGQGGQGGFGGAPRTAGGIDDMLERSPTIATSDLKVGDIIAFSSTKSPDLSRIKAIKLFAGVEPFLRSAQAAGGRRGQGGVEAGFSIPGLEGP
ncbi:MAG: hypothetical protein ABIV48_12480 [Pyrinomonadaceae bacterium]